MDTKTDRSTRRAAAEGRGVVIVLKALGTLVILAASVGFGVAITGLPILGCMRITIDDGDDA